MHKFKLARNNLKSFILICYFILILLFKLIRNKKVIIICDQYGRLGNRLYLFSQFILFCKKNNFELWIPGFYEYKSYFSNKNNSISFQSSIEKNLYFINEHDFYYSIVRILKIIKRIKFFNSFIFNFQCEEDGNPWLRIHKTKIPLIFFEGFIFFKYKLETENNLALIKNIFQPASQFDYEINKPIDLLTKDSSLLCGILIRQTDYRSWNNGKYFFTTLDYLQIIYKINSLLCNNKITFFIATDEIQDESLFEGINCYIRTGYPLENLYSLSKCDFLLGPPSSYIGWASYYGNRNLFTIESISHFQSNITHFINTKVHIHQ